MLLGQEKLKMLELSFQPAEKVKLKIICTVLQSICNDLQIFYCFYMEDVVLARLKKKHLMLTTKKKHVEEK